MDRRPPTIYLPTIAAQEVLFRLIWRHDRTFCGSLTVDSAWDSWKGSSADGPKASYPWFNCESSRLYGSVHRPPRSTPMNSIRQFAEYLNRLDIRSDA